MHERIAALRNRRESGEGGFTLVELLVVVVIIGILIAIAIPLYLNYKKGANDKAAMSDLRATVSMLEKCNGDNSGYPAVSGTTYDTTNCAGPKLSTNTTFTYALSSDSKNYSAWTSNSGGGKTYCYTSVAGGSIKSSSTTVGTYTATC